MNVVFSLILLAAALGCIVFLLTRRENARRGAFLRGAEEMPPAFPAISAAGHIAFRGRFWYDTIEISGFVGGIAGWQMCW